MAGLGPEYLLLHSLQKTLFWKPFPLSIFQISKINKMTQSKEKKMQDDRVSAIFQQQHFYSNYTTV
jgi:hypothetical protein